MGYAYETVNATVSAAAVTTEQLLSAGTGQSLAVRAAGPGATVTLDWVAANVSGNAQLSIRSPRLHDNTKGILVQAFSGTQAPILDEGFDQVVYSQDTLTIGLTFAAAPGAGTIEQVTFGLIYTDLPGVQANMRTWAEVQPNIIEYAGAITSPTNAASPGSWGTGVALNSTFDTLKANQLYAVIGYEVNTACSAVALQGPDIGNLLVGGPGPQNGIDTRRFFVYHSLAQGIPYIPVINSANKASTNAFVATTTASSTVAISWILARLSA